MFSESLLGHYQSTQVEIWAIKGKHQQNKRRRADHNLREELRQDCKTFIYRFDSDRRLQFFQKTFHTLRRLHR